MSTQNNHVILLLFYHIFDMYNNHLPKTFLLGILLHSCYAYLVCNTAFPELGCACINGVEIVLDLLCDGASFLV